MTLTLAEANTIVAAAIAKARQLNIIVNVAVCDDQGHLISFNRMDRAYAEGDRFALGKAVVSAGTGLPSGEVEGHVDHPPVAGVSPFLIASVWERDADGSVQRVPVDLGACP
jgi:glc operon protein GlcG